MTTTTIEPGCIMPCVPLSPEHPDLWWYAVEATETGLESALCDEPERRSHDRFKHLVFFPTWSEGRIGFFRVRPGQKVRVEASAENTLKVIGEGFETEFPGQILVIAHSSLESEALKSYYAQEA